ncbi:hypothetical protein ACVWWN_001432 [Mycobacterium sp. URHB0021]
MHRLVVGRVFSSWCAPRFDRVFDELVAAASVPGGGVVGAWARVENAACARKLAAMADGLARRWGAEGSAEREQWCLDNWDAVCAEIGAAFNVSLGVASHQLTLAWVLRERLPRVGEVFTAGLISARLVHTIVYRTALITDPDARAKVDIEIAAQAVGWGPWSVARTERALDELVDRHDRQALRRWERRARGRHFDVLDGAGGAGTAGVEGVLFAPDAAVLDQRLAVMAAAVCAADPRTGQQRRADALGALGRGQDHLACLCGATACPAGGGGGPSAAAVVVHVIAEADSLTDDTPALLDGAPPAPEAAVPLREQTPAEALTEPAPPAPSATAHTSPAVIVGGGLLPPPLLAAKVAGAATLRRLVHPGAAGPEPRYTPSRALADFVRCRDLTCRFPGCEEPAYICDLDHTIAYPAGPTCASNLKCLCRKHHLLKTFWDWSDRQLPDGTVQWTAPSGQAYTTHPGSRLCSQPCAHPPHPSRGSICPQIHQAADWPCPDAPAPVHRTAPTASKPNADSTTSTPPNTTSPHPSNS